MGKEQLMVTLGDSLYKVVRPWGTLPKSIRMDDISKLAIDRSDNVYIFQRSNPPLVVFSPDGKFIGSWGEGTIVDAHGIFIDKEDRIFLVDRDAHHVLVTDTAWNVLFSIGEKHKPRFGAPFNHPTDAAVGPNGDIFVADGYGNTMIHCFSSDGTHKHSWGGRGRGPGEFSIPHAIWVLSDGRVLVGDREHGRIQLFKADGTYVTEWKNFYRPMDFYADEGDCVYVTEMLPRVTKLKDGVVIGSCKAVATFAHGMRGDSQGNIFLVERIKPTITKLELVERAGGV